MSVPPPRVSSAPPEGVRASAGASPLPLVAGAVALAASVMIAIVAEVWASTPAKLVVPGIPLVRGDFWWLSFLGYLLTPIIVIGCYGWDVLSQRNGLRANRDFVLNPRWTRWLLVIVAAAIVVGVWHVLNLSVPVSEWLGFA